MARALAMLGWCLAGVAAMFVAAELLLRLLPLTSGLAAAEPAPGWPIFRWIPDRSYVESSGWDLENVQRGHVNGEGFLAPFDYRDGAAAGIVIGDSYVEGYMNPYGAMLQARLAADLGMPRDAVYNFGTPGASLPHYLGLARIAGARYRPLWAVVVVTARDFDEGFDHDVGYFHWAPGDPSLIALSPARPHGRLQRIVRELAIPRYAKINLHFTTASLLGSGMAATVAPAGRCREVALSASDAALVDGYPAALAAALRLPPGRVVLVFDTDRQAIYDGRAQAPPCATRDWLARLRLADRARAAGVGVLDTAPLFAAAWARDHQPLDRSPLDAHWNPYAHGIVAHAVAAMLAGAQRGPVRRVTP